MSIFEEYAILDAEIKELENKKDSLRAGILKEMVERGEEKIETSVGKFTVAKTKTWTYPEHVLKIGEDFAAAKEKAKSTKEATFEESESLRFTSIKL